MSYWTLSPLVFRSKVSLCKLKGKILYLFNIYISSLPPTTLTTTNSGDFSSKNIYQLARGCHVSNFRRRLIKSNFPNIYYSNIPFLPSFLHIHSFINSSVYILAFNYSLDHKHKHHVFFYRKD
ncbi:hypothetical protein QVD17_16222 [Tagetes erecta]|uniref:Uncharacterized protein n=1 Tax=Tagetes erecta TaxID=13708 RepID=A0AAD8KQJ1_TARER|nr:hypothetical protein QVD17_16222 [Tagetes erecta]